jgi:hypothetical protein
LHNKIIDFTTLSSHESFQGVPKIESECSKKLAYKHVTLFAFRFTTVPYNPRQTR